MVELHHRSGEDRLGDAVQLAWEAYVKAGPARKYVAQEQLIGALTCLILSRLRTKGIPDQDAEGLCWDLVAYLLRYLSTKAPAEIDDLRRLARVSAGNVAATYFRSRKPDAPSAAELDFGRLVTDTDRGTDGQVAEPDEDDPGPAVAAEQIHQGMAKLHEAYRCLLERLYLKVPPDSLEGLIDEQCKNQGTTSAADYKRIGQNVYKLHERAKIALAKSVRQATAAKEPT